MVKLYDSGVYLLNGKTLVREKDAELSLNKEEAKKGTIAYGILQAHNTSGDPENLKIKFDAITLHMLASSRLHELLVWTNFRCPMC